MKTNLKNFPDVLQPKPTIEGCLEYAKMINEWLEAFEKELRTRLQKQITWTQIGQTRVELIEEILGDDS